MSLLISYSLVMKAYYHKIGFETILWLCGGESQMWEGWFCEHEIQSYAEGSYAAVIFVLEWNPPACSKMNDLERAKFVISLSEPLAVWRVWSSDSAGRTKTLCKTIVYSFKYLIARF